ncbi:MAG: TetR/AcrR family transcriptional regulator [Lachnospiraceae bacterium]|nr:TetR/AcrR family transcriptional regulator [Lachnospiraceae bacterium]
MIHKEDRQTKRSKRLLKQGLLELMGEKKFTDITVRDITERSDLNRGTFYLHYSNTYDLLTKLESEMFADVQAIIDEHSVEANSGTLQPILEPILSYIVQNKDICYTLYRNTPGGSFVDKMHKLIYKNGVAIIHHRFPAASDERLRYLLSFITYGLIGLIKEWFDTDMKTENKEIVKIADTMLNALAEKIFATFK